MLPCATKPDLGQTSEPGYQVYLEKYTKQYHIEKAKNSGIKWQPEEAWLWFDVRVRVPLGENLSKQVWQVRGARGLPRGLQPPRGRQRERTSPSTQYCSFPGRPAPPKASGA